MPAAPSQPFPPPPTDIAPLLADLRRGDLSFNALAAHHNITPDTLALWLNSPAIRQQLEATDTVSTYRTRLIAADTLPRAAVALNILLQRYITAHQHPTNPHELAPTPQQPVATSSTSDIPHPTSNIPTHEAARRAAATLVRIANLRPTPSPESLSRKREVFPAPQDASPNTAPAPTTPRAQEQTTEDLIQAGLQAAANFRASLQPEHPTPQPNTPAPEPTAFIQPTPTQPQLTEYTAEPQPQDFDHAAFRQDLEALIANLESNPDSIQDPDQALQAILQKHAPIPQPQAQSP